MSASCSKGPYALDIQLTERHSVQQPVDVQPTEHATTTECSDVQWSPINNVQLNVKVPLEVYLLNVALDLDVRGRSCGAMSPPGYHG